MVLSRAALLFNVARSQGALQTSCARRRLGGHAATCLGAHLYRLPRQTRARSFRRTPVSDLCLFRTDPVGVLLYCSNTKRPQSRQQRAPDHESLFSAPADAAFGRRGTTGRFYCCFRSTAWIAGLLPDAIELEHSGSTNSDRAYDPCRTCCRRLVRSHKREVSRRRRRPAGSDSALDVCFADRLSVVADPRELAQALCA